MPLAAPSCTWGPPARSGGRVIEQQFVVGWMGNWPAPFGICPGGRLLQRVMVLITAVIHTAVTVYARRDIDAGMVRAGFYPFMQI
jgi:multicomponent Na+:H+ antiporter subunit D